jgi:dolichyl-phosphate beta-glucosyltransferase
MSQNPQRPTRPAATRPGAAPSAFAISVVIPIGANASLSPLLTSVRALARAQRGRFEVVLVDDATPEGLESLVRCWRGQFESVAVARHEQVKGRGACVRTGVLATRGDLIVVVEPDTRAPLTDAAKLLASLRAGADVALISRRMPGMEMSGNKSFLERAAETTVLKLSQLLVPTGIYDCMSGLQALRSRAAKQIAQRASVSGPAYSIEWLAIAQSFGFRIAENPISQLIEPQEGAERTSTSSLSVLREAWRTRKRLSTDDHLQAKPATELLSSTSFQRLDRDALNAAKRP